MRRAMSTVGPVRPGAARRTALGAVLAVAVASAAAAVDRLPSEPELRLEPDEIAAGLFYHGQILRAVGRVPADSEIVVEIRGANLPVELKQKGRVWGLLWANVGDVTLECVPALYLAASSTPLVTLETWLAPERLDVGYSALKNGCEGQLSPGRDPSQGIFDEFIKLKETERLYAVHEGGVSMQSDGDGIADFSTDFFIPADAPEGTLTVRLLVFEGSEVWTAAESALVVRQAGLAAWVSSLAAERGLLYGLLAVVIALVAGLLTGLVFGLGSSGGH